MQHRLQHRSGLGKVHGWPDGVQTAVAVAVGVGVSVGVLVGVLVGVSVGVFVGVLVGVSVGVFVGVGVAVLKLRTTVGWDRVPPFVAEIVTGTSDPTLAAFITMDRQPLPAGITIDEGTGRMPGWLLVSATVAPPVGAAPVRQTVILPCPPPRITV